MDMDTSDAPAPSGRVVAVPLSSAGNEMINVNLVESRPGSDRSVVHARTTDKIRPDDLVALASQVQNARQLVKGRACDRLRTIAQQMEQLHMQARRVLEDAEKDEALHKVACNMQKQPGRVYHLYERDDRVRYFSLLTPDEWNRREKQDEFVGSYRLEYDGSWTSLEDAAMKDAQTAHLQQLLSRGSAGATGTGYGMLGWGQSQ